MIYASSSAVYGQAGGAAALDETLAVAPTSNYGTAKRFGELYLAAQHTEHGLQSVALRIFNIFGPRQDRRLVIPRFVKDALDKSPIEIYGDGEQTRDFVYVADVVAAALALASSALGCEIVNACSGRETSIRGLAEAVLRLSGSSAPVVARPMPGNRTVFEIERCYGSRAKLQRLAGAVPITSLEDGLNKTIASIRALAVSLPAELRHGGCA
ncbi:MAG: NAD-dependent epimerase/dehydratase family protein, partial [Xanthobacteraceae bacterium]